MLFFLTKNKLLVGVLLVLIGLVAALAAWQVPEIGSKMTFYAIGGIGVGLFLIVTNLKKKK